MENLRRNLQNDKCEALTPLLKVFNNSDKNISLGKSKKVCDICMYIDRLSMQIENRESMLDVLSRTKNPDLIVNNCDEFYRISKVLSRDESRRFVVEFLKQIDELDSFTAETIRLLKEKTFNWNDFIPVREDTILIETPSDIFQNGKKLNSDSYKDECKKQIAEKKLLVNYLEKYK